MKKVLSKISVIAVGFLTPALAFAQVDTSGLYDLLNKVDQLLNRIIPILIGLALLTFMWGILRYLFTQDKENARSFMIWGIIALFVMTSVWGLVGILKNTVLGSGTNTTLPPTVPRIPSAGYQSQ